MTTPERAVEAQVARTRKLIEHVSGATGTQPPVRGFAAGQHGPSPSARQRLEVIAAALHGKGQLREIGSFSYPLEPQVARAVNAVIPWLPEPLKLKHGPVLTTVETWTDGTVVARAPMTGLHGEGESDDLALEDLTDNMLEFAQDMRVLSREKEIGGPLRRQWEAFCQLVDVSAVPDR